MAGIAVAEAIAEITMAVIVAEAIAEITMAVIVAEAIAEATMAAIVEVAVTAVAIAKNAIMSERPKLKEQALYRLRLMCRWRETLQPQALRCGTNSTQTIRLHTLYILQAKPIL